jgi:transposase-like protein
MEPPPETLGKIVAGETVYVDARRVLCPWCDSADVEKISEYGPHLMVCSYICRQCNSPFEVIKR